MELSQKRIVAVICVAKFLERGESLCRLRKIFIDESQAFERMRREIPEGVVKVEKDPLRALI